MTVRGSCSCYGHAQRCLPEKEEHKEIQGMVHGKCDCTHNTRCGVNEFLKKEMHIFRFLRLRGNNCEYCLDDHNDVPWRPGTGKKKNECKSEAHIQSRDKHILKDLKCSQNRKTVKGGKIKLIRICFYSYVTFCFVYAVSRGDLIALSKKKLFLGTEYVYIDLIHFRVQLPRPRRILLLQPLRV